MRAATWVVVCGICAGLGCNNDEPDLDVVREVSVRIDPEAPDTTVDLVALADDAENADAGFEYQWSVNGSVDPNAFTDTIPSERTARDQVWEVTVWPTGEREGPGWSASATIANTPPTVAVEFDPFDPLPGDPVDLIIETGDIDSDTVTLDFAWTADGVERSDVDGDRIPAGITGGGEEWAVTVTADDGADTTTVTEALRIGNRAPEIDAVRFQPAAFRHGEPVEAVVEASDPDGDALEFTFEWTVDGEVVGTESGLDGSQYVRGQEVRVSVIATDGLLDSDEAVASAITSNTPPVVTAPTLVYSGDVRRSSPLTCSPGETSDVDGDEVEVRYAWVVNEDVQNGSEKINQDLVRKGRTINCRTTPHDGFDSGPYADSDSVLVGNTPPGPGKAVLTPVYPKTDDPIVATLTGPVDIDGDPLTYDYAWTVNGKAVSSSRDTLSTFHFEKHDRVRVSITPNDGTADGPASSTEITVVNTPPVAPRTSILPSSPTTSQDLRCVLTASPTDADASDTLTITYTWYLGFTPWMGTTKDGGKTISSTSTRSGQNWSCIVKVSDGSASDTNSGGNVTIR